MDWVLHMFAFVGPFGLGSSSRDDTLTCLRDGGEDWPMVQRELLRLLNGGGQTNALTSQLARASTLDPQVAPQDCLPGRISLRLLLLLTGSQVSAQDAEDLVGADWYALGVLGWPAIISSGWPIFRLLRLLQSRMEREIHDEAMAEDATVPMCGDSTEPFSVMLMRYVRHRRMQEGESLLAASVEYLAKNGGSSHACPLSSAASFLAVAWGRYPVYDVETEDLLRLAQPLVSQLKLASVLTTRHALLQMLDDMASTYQAFLIDSGALYEDLRPTDVTDAPLVDYTRHMMNDRGARKTGAQVCPWLSLRTPLGHCNPFAYLGSSLSRWRQQGVRLEDVAQALRVSGPKRQVGRPRTQTHGPLVLLRLIGQELVAVEPKRSDGVGRAGDIEAPQVACLAQEILSLLSVVKLPDFDIVVNLGSRPLLSKYDENDVDEMQQFKYQEAPSLPLFSVCYSHRFWDIPFPSPCAETQCEYAFATQARIIARSRKSHALKPCIYLKNGTRSCGQHLDMEPDLMEMLDSASNHSNMYRAEESARGFSFARQCYLLQILLSYSDRLNYAPSNVQTAFFGHPVVHAFKAPNLQKNPDRPQSQDFAMRCRDTIDALAQ